MKKIMWAGLSFIILAGIVWLIWPLADTSQIRGVPSLIIFSVLLFVLGFLIMLFTVIGERIDEIKTEKGKYKQYEEEK